MLLEAAHMLKMTCKAAGHVPVLQVYADSVEFGRQLGRWQAHKDTVACLQLMHSSQLASTSWDCSIKIWLLLANPWIVIRCACVTGVCLLCGVWQAAGSLASPQGHSGMPAAHALKSACKHLLGLLHQDLAVTGKSMDCD